MCSTMSWIYLVFIALVLAGFFFNIRMLWSCIKKDKRKYTLLRHCRPLIICQFVYQISIVSMNAIDTWIELNVQQETEYCSIQKLLPNFMTLFLVCNSLAILMIELEVPVVYQNRKSLLLLSAAMCLGLICSVVLWWNSCFRPEEFIFKLALSTILLVPFSFLLIVDWRNYMPLDRTTPNDSMQRSSVLWNCPNNKTKETVLFIALLLWCFVTIIMFPSLSFLEFEQIKVFREVTFLFMTNNIINGIILPVIINGLIDSSYKGNNEHRITSVWQFACMHSIRSDWSPAQLKSQHRNWSSSRVQDVVGWLNGCCWRY